MTVTTIPHDDIAGDYWKTMKVGDVVRIRGRHINMPKYTQRAEMELFETGRKFEVFKPDWKTRGFDIKRVK